MNKILAMLQQVLTEPNNHTLCPVRIGAVITLTQGLALTVYSVVVQHAPFNLQDYGVGAGVLLAAVGAALGLKKDSA
jgi:hypothetical protein